MATKFASGKKSKAISDISGFEVRYTQLKTTWDNLRVEPSEFDTKHPQLTPARNVTDATALRNPRPLTDPENVEILIGFTSSITLSRVLRSQQAPVGITTFGRIGHVGISLAEPVTGISGTGAIGTAQAGIGVNGANATGNVGNATPEDEISVQEQGVAGDGEIGAVALGATLTGASGNGNIGTSVLNFDRIFDQTGVNATGALGEETFDVRTGTITGIAGAGALGSATIGSEPQASGVAGTGNTQPVGQAGGGSFSISTFGVGVAGIAGTGVEVGEANIPESTETGWNKNAFGYGVWGGDGDIEAVGAVGTVVVDPFVGPNPVNSVSGTGAVGTLIFDQNISFATGWGNNAWNNGTWSGTDTSMGISANGQVGTVDINSSIEISSGVSGTGTTGTEAVTIDGGWGENGWNLGTWSN